MPWSCRILSLDVHADYASLVERQGGSSETRSVMGKFRIQPHGRLQEWVAEEKGYFKDEGLDYEFVFGQRDGITGSLVNATMQTTEEAPRDVLQGAFESMEAGRACEVSAACH